MIFVITGTERFPIDRMVKEVDRLVDNSTIQQEVFFQLGACSYEPKHGEWKRFLSFGEMCERIEQSDTIIAHAGAGTTLLCIQLGHHPFLIPRRKKFGEHIDDHQLSFSKKFETTGMIYVVYDMKSLAEYVNQSTKIDNFKINNNKRQLVKYLNSLISVC